jgi:hypothetical protein
VSRRPPFSVSNAARDFLVDSGGVPLRSAISACNMYLTKLRSGNRRRTQGELRRRLRALRASLAEKLRGCAS